MLLGVLIIPFIIGVLDDLLHLEPSAKLIAQCITASLIFFVLDIRLTSLYGLTGDQELPQAISYTITLLVVVIITNSLNLIDGIDGLAAAFSFMAGIAFGTWFLFTGYYQFALICYALCGGILAFLFHNWEPSKIFMGDTGSLVIGTLLAIIMIRFINNNHVLENGHPFKFNSSIGTAIAIMIIPLIDTTRIIIVRLSKKISPFAADKRHIHHELLSLHLSHRQAVYILIFVHFVFIALSVITRGVNDWMALTWIIVLSTVLCLVLEKLHKRDSPANAEN